MLGNRTIGGTLLLALIALLGGHARGANGTGSGDEEYLKSEKVGTSTNELEAFLRKHIPSDEQRRRIEGLVAQLGSDRFAVRVDAGRQLVEQGWPALPFLKQAARSTDPEVKTRAEVCLEKIAQGPSPALQAAAVRLLVERHPPEALPLLLEYFPDAGEDGIEEEILTGLGRLAPQAEGDIDPRLLAAANDPVPARRAAVACVLGRVGGPKRRGLVRGFLADKAAIVRLHAAHGLLGVCSPRSGDAGQPAEDEAVLRKAAVGVDAAALEEFFRKRTLREAEMRQVEGLLKQLGSDRFREREEASRRLIDFGPGVLAPLRPALRSADQEVARRAEVCIETIMHNPGPTLPMAALRLLARRPTAAALHVLLDYLPFADDARVEDECLTTLALLSVREPRIDPVLLDALKDRQPVQRAAAALVLAQVGDQDQCALVRDRLKDPEPRVRLRAAQGLLAARDKTAVDVLIRLLTDGDLPQAAQAESLLQQLAADRSPGEALGAGAPQERRRCQDLWLAWWRDVGSKEDLLGRERTTRYLGLTLVAELIGNQASGNRVCELGLDGKPRWELTSLQGPIDAQVVARDRVLVAEHNAQVVTERDRKGDVKWQCKVNGNPVACQRLPSGNTFIATYNTLMEVRSDGQVVYQYTPNVGGGVIYDACKLTNGTIACVAGRGTVVELDAAGKKLNTIQVGANGGWCGVSPLPNGRYLVAMVNPGKVVEIDRAGKVHWECNVPSACHAVRLPNGNTLVACMNVQKVVEVNRSGQTVWSQSTIGRPFHVRRR